MRAENDLFLAKGSTDLVLLWVVNIDLSSVLGERNGLNSIIGVGVELHFVWLVKID